MHSLFSTAWGSNPGPISPKLDTLTTTPPQLKSFPCDVAHLAVPIFIPVPQPDTSLYRLVHHVVCLIATQLLGQYQAAW